MWIGAQVGTPPMTLKVIANCRKCESSGIPIGADRDPRCCAFTNNVRRLWHTKVGPYFDADSQILGSNTLQEVELIT